MNSLQKRKVKKVANAELRIFLFVISCMAVFPLIYLQQRILSSNLSHSNYKNSSSVYQSLEKFYSTKARRRDQQHLIRQQPKPHPHRKVLTAYLEPLDSINADILPIPKRNTSAQVLKPVLFQRVSKCSTLMQDFPIDDFPLQDPYLPWIHDYFPSMEGDYIQFVAQNRRRCDTGEDHQDTMKFWEPQVALFQPIPIIADFESGSFRLAPNIETATHNATRFQCHFHSIDSTKSKTTLSEYTFDYEYVNWRKGGKKKPMLTQGKDTESYWLSQLMFKCPVPSEFQALILRDVREDKPSFFLDLIPIRTPARGGKVLLTSVHSGPKNLPSSDAAFDTALNFGKSHYLPRIEDAGRWANLPICRRDKTGQVDPLRKNQKKYRLVACTWASSSYTRRGDTVRVSDSAKRLNEWIHYNLLVGFDHLVVYDNSEGNATELQQVVNKFSKEHVTYHRWNCKVCNNNRPAHKNPGERSSQYAAEASCRERYGPQTEWMSFLDTDEYLVPMKANEKGVYNWNTVLDEMDVKKLAILKFLSSRGRPRIDLMETMEDQSTCVDPVIARGPNKNKTEPCIGPKKTTTFLQVYNCDYIRPPKPERFQRAMKQIYRPSYVLSHFVHYSTITADMAETYSQFISHSNPSSYDLNVRERRFTEQSPELFLNELTQGSLIHSRSILPHETMRRSAECFNKSPWNCMLGYLCEDEILFSDEKHKDNTFQKSNGEYCNCWRNPVVDDTLVPLLAERIQSSS